MRLFHSFLAAALTLAVAACSSTGGDQPAAPVVDGAAATTAGGNGPAANSNANAPIDVRPGPGANAATELTDPKSVLSRRSVYFNFDEFSVREEFRSTLQAHATWLASHRDARMLIQGNTDERGSREYNIALGQRRAEAMKRMLVLMGAAESQIDAVSLGKEKPRREGHEEADWAENRRGDILYSFGSVKEF
jgi:peptidoglycan-associated lipoprotein